MPGVVAVIQTFGDRINFHPHIHVLITEGGTASDQAPKVLSGMTKMYWALNPMAA